MSYTNKPQDDKEAFENQSMGFYFDMGMDYSKVDNVVVEGVDTEDYPDFCDAYIESADYDGREMTESELDVLNQDTDFVYECVNKYYF